MMRKHLILTLSISIMCSSSYANYQTKKVLTCLEDSVSEGHLYEVTSDAKLSIKRTGWTNQSILNSTPVTLTKGKLSFKETLTLEGQKEQVKIEEKNVTLIKDIDDVFQILIESIPFQEYEGKRYFKATIIKGAIKLDLFGGESIVLDKLTCEAPREFNLI
jgi:hypothetical protein